MHATITLLPGDGIGPEVVREGVKVLKAVGAKFGHTFEFNEALAGGIAIDQTGSPLPDESLAACQRADAVLLGAVGGPKWSDPKAPVRPEQGLLKLRKELGLFANIRPVKIYPALADASTLKREVVEKVDMIIVRELTGGLYFGQPQGRQDNAQGRAAVDTMYYTEAEIGRLMRISFDLARQRRKKLTSVDKANVLASSRLWREVAHEVAAEYPDVEYEDILVDACSMYLIRRPADFDVIATENMFGDILSDEASMLAGSMGMLPSASLGEKKTSAGGQFGLYEPIHGSAPDIAGKGIANPLATILSVAMLLRTSLNLSRETEAVEAAVEAVLAAGHRSPDLAGRDQPMVGTKEMGDLVVAHL
ncbi:MAG: 3-isopropylmalate dehydrogenase [Anaerolineae bacterium]|nr:3-isopropylmalate dehydrogenase [Anaerolineales bacterium]MCQ3977268.1 3-isopropylmalate dehydrogenase [Anaerolineae bacterium]